MNHDTTFYVVMAVIYGLAAYNALRVLIAGYTPGATIAWIAFLLAFPFASLPAFYLFGSSRIQNYVRRHRKLAAEISGSDSVFQFPPPPDAREVPAEVRPTYQTLAQVFGGFGSLYEPSPGTAQLLIDGESTFRAIFDAIASARHYIFVQYYILRSDRLGLELKRLLMEKAKARVPVYVLYDDMGSFWLSRQYIRDLKLSGVRVERFLPVTSFKRFFQMNFRNHRKLVVVDGTVAFTGGLNVGEEYAARRSRRSSRRYWRDTHVRLTGPTVTRLEDVFCEDWYFATEEKLDGLHTRTESPAPPTTSSSARELPALLQVIPTGPTDAAPLALYLLMEVIASAKERLWIATPYFVPDPAIVRCLELAALRGVDVRLLLPEVGDARFVHWVSLSYAEQVQSRGIQVMLYGAGFMHQKAILVDRTLGTVGTMNLDNRAVYLNFETTIVVHGREFNAALDAVFERDFLGCRVLTPPRHQVLRFLVKLRGNAARLAGPLL